jgi:hypothetical protein
MHKNNGFSVSESGDVSASDRQRQGPQEYLYRLVKRLSGQM